MRCDSNPDKAGSMLPSGSDEADSSEFESFSEDEDVQNVVTQRDVFGSDAGSEESSPNAPPKLPEINDESDVSQEDQLGSERKNINSGDSSSPHSSTMDSRSADDERFAQPNATLESSGMVRVREHFDSDGTNDGAADGSIAEDDPERAGDADDGDQEPDETRIAVDFPLIRADLGKEMHLVKMPNFLSVETRPFDPNFYEDELDEDEVLDEEGRTRLKLKVENTIRWRIGKTPDGEPVHESNSRIVRWSDGSLSLHLGDEIFDIHKVDIHSDYNYLFIREGSGLQGQSSLRTKLTFRPHSTDSFTHRKITLSLADKTNKSQKVKILPVAGGDPESNRNALVRKEEEKLRATLRRESQLRRMRERQAISRNSFTGAGTSERRRHYGTGEDEDDEDDDNTTSLNALKRNAKNALKASRRDVSAIYSSESESLSDISEPRKRARARISDEGESD